MRPHGAPSNELKILLWHGYLLGGTGSNVYTRALAREWARAGHDVTVLSQEPHPERHDLGGADAVRPDVGGLLPVFVLDRYAGYEVKLLQDCTRAELDDWVERNAAAVRERLPADLVFTNHVLLGGPVGAASGARYAVKAHGSELVHEVPPGVDVDEWRPQPREEALAALLAEARRDPPNPGNANERLPDEGNAERLEAFLGGDERTVVYFGKLLYNKGVHVLLEALRDVDARAVIVGFGDYREALEGLAGPRTLFTGPLEHRHLVHLLALADATVVPSIFPEAFGMVAAEAAAAGSPPLVARHSGLAEIASGLEEEYPPHLRHLAGFRTGDASELAQKLHELLSLPPADRVAIRSAARAATVARWSWAGVARRLLEPFDYAPANG